MVKKGDAMTKNLKLVANPRTIEAHLLIAPMLATKKRGDTVTYEEIDKATGHAGEARHYVRFVQRWVRDNIGAVCEPIPNVGYRIGDALAHIRVAGVQARSARRKLRRESIALSLTPAGELDAPNLRVLDHMRRASAVKIATVAAEDGATKKLLGGRPAPLPRMIANK